jgi:hypothetical protein
MDTEILFYKVKKGDVLEDLGVCVWENNIKMYMKAI